MPHHLSNVVEAIIWHGNLLLAVSNDDVTAYKSSRMTSKVFRTVLSA